MAVSDKYHLGLHFEHVSMICQWVACPTNQPLSAKDQCLLPPLLINGRALFMGTKAQCLPAMFSMLMDRFKNTVGADKAGWRGPTRPLVWVRVEEWRGWGCEVRLIAPEPCSYLALTSWVIPSQVDTWH